MARSLSLEPAAQYVRMSTERQDLSVEMQTAANAAFALVQGYEIIRTFSDEGISGLSIDKRAGLKALIADVVQGSADFKTILVYDVSRWGRFQNIDEAAHYEFLCSDAGVRIEYTAEPFSNDGSVTASIVKALKRAMAAEYSRELSVKTAAAQETVARRGFWAGSTCGYGFRREGVSRQGKVLGRHGFGEPKELGAHTRLVEGPPEEVRTVRRIYRMYLRDHLSLCEIARRLNAGRVASESCRPWTHHVVKTILTSEKYMGQVIRGRVRTHLGHSARQPDRASWQVIEGAAPALVSKRLWQAIQVEMAGRRRAPLRDELLSDLKRLERRNRYVSALIVKREGRYRPRHYAAEFGSLANAISIAGCNLSLADVTAAWRRECCPTSSKRPHRTTDETILRRLRNALVKHGYLSESLLKSSREYPDPHSCIFHFGSLARAYAMVGYVPEGAQASMLARQSSWTTPTEEADLRAAAQKHFLDGYTPRCRKDVITDKLRRLLELHGRLTVDILVGANDLPCVPTLKGIFGSIDEVYAAAGYTPNARQRARLEHTKVS